MKKIICSIVFFMSVSAVSFSQNGGKMQYKERKDFAKELNLSDEQKTKVKELNDTYKVKIDELRKNSSLSKDERRKQMRDLSDQKHNDMKKILTADQIAKLDARKDQRQDRQFKNRDGRHHRQPMMQRGDSCRMNCMKDLNLTEDQQAKMKALKDKYADKSKALREERRTEFENILTAYQKAKLAEFRKDRPNRPNRMMQHRPPMMGQKTCNVVGNKELPQDVKLKLEELEANFVKERQAIRSTRITVAMQDKKIDELRTKYREDRRAIMKEAFQKK